METRKSHTNRADQSYNCLRLADFVKHLRRSSADITKEVEIKSEGLVSRINRVLLVSLSRFCRVDLDAHYDFYWSQETLDVDKSQSRGLHQEEKASKKQSKLDWTLIALIYYIYIVIKTGVNIYFQYIYDYHLFQLKYAQVGTNNNFRLEARANISTGTQEEQVKLVKLAASRRNLDYCGAPFYKSSYFIEIAYEFLIVLSFMTYIDGQYILYNCPMDFRFARVILYPRREHLNHIQLVCREVNKFIVSSRNFSSTYLNALDSNFEQRIPTKKTDKQNSSIDASMLEQANCVRQLKRLALTDQLRPLNWSPAWVEQLSIYYCVYTLTCLFWAFSILLVTGLTSPVLFDVDFGQFSVLDHLMAIENILIIFYLILSMTFYSSSLFICSTDQIFYVNELRSLIRQRLHQNRDKFFNLMDTRHIPAGQIAINQRRKIRDELWLGEMNCNLLYCFMHYKIFVAQFKTHKRIFMLISFHAIIIWFFLPIMARLHASYTTQSVKMLQLYICVALCLIVNFILVPICHLYSCSCDLYKTLSDLLASTIETQSIDMAKCQTDTNEISKNMNTKKSMYNLHLIALLRKELNEPAIFMRQFETISFGLHITYPSLVKIHFWFGVILLSLISGVTTGHDTLFGSSLRDPFGLFQ